VTITNIIVLVDTLELKRSPLHTGKIEGRAVADPACSSQF